MPDGTEHVHRGDGRGRRDAPDRGGTAGGRPPRRTATGPSEPAASLPSRSPRPTTARAGSRPPRPRGRRRRPPRRAPAPPAGSACTAPTTAPRSTRSRTRATGRAGRGT
ncbi:hypothetical protein Cus16_0655 [Curtobacterium sp. ER1/6]|nr:hypothetical protein Cus16_0655 [Curtobacterium sp. ER1/6]